MSFNAIEMQIALSRTQDAGKIQEQNQQKNLIQQDHAAHQVRENQERKQKTVVKNKSFPLIFMKKKGMPINGSFLKKIGRKKIRKKQQQ
ncbi:MULTISPECIES: hypothetical protein [unclassified Peribacillus]|jgi:hypothetical protein|uniref:hypothetical protein n=1 Tax=unclassified Peribacillus TaxID=2675266 RepID=UPI001913F95E|nr:MULTISPECIES: hypothetical protein [unclassified Peribacillus]MBK5445933.1 hypothetical protein [Peribacillus sp. TH24]WMX57320.1 hypothetical protein RE409_08925 [Peribacillus sp. R9-11]